jgi:hypothetical protein
MHNFAGPHYALLQVLIQSKYHYEESKSGPLIPVEGFWRILIRSAMPAIDMQKNLPVPKHTRTVDPS